MSVHLGKLGIELQNLVLRSLHHLHPFSMCFFLECQISIPKPASRFPTQALWEYNDAMERTNAAKEVDAEAAQDFSGVIELPILGNQTIQMYGRFPDLPIMAPEFVKPSGYQVSDVNYNGYISRIPIFFLGDGDAPNQVILYCGGPEGGEQNWGCQC